MRLLLQPLFENVCRTGGVLVVAASVAAFLPFGFLSFFISAPSLRFPASLGLES